MCCSNHSFFVLTLSSTLKAVILMLCACFAAEVVINSGVTFTWNFRLSGGNLCRFLCLTLT